MKLLPRAVMYMFAFIFVGLCLSLSMSNLAFAIGPNDSVVGGKVDEEFTVLLQTGFEDSNPRRDYKKEIVQGQLPPGVYLRSRSNANFVLEGTPTAIGVYNVTVRITAEAAWGTNSTNHAQIRFNAYKRDFIYTIQITDHVIKLHDLPIAGKVGLAYTGQASATGGTVPYIYEITGLPAGLTATDAGAVSGTPTAAGSFPVTVKVTDQAGETRTIRQTIVIAAAPDIALNVTGIPAAGKVGLGYTGQAAASGGTDPYTFEITGLPTGLTATNAGVISGKPTAAGSFPVTVKVTDKEGYTKTETQTIVIAAAPDIALNVAGIPAAGKVGLGYTGQAAASGGTDPYTFEVTGLPAGLTATDAGVVSGKPTAAGSFPVTVKVTDKEGYTKTETQTIVIAVAPDIALNVTGIPAAGKVGLGYTGQAAATGGTDPYTFEITGLPAGLTATNAGVISGKPTAVGSSTVTVKVTDKEGYTKTETQTIVIAAAPDIALNVTGIPAAGKVGLGYTGQAAASGGTDPYTFEITGLPAGLTATNAGAVSGKPTAVGSSTVTVKVTDKEGYTKTETQTIVIAAAPDIALNVTGIPAAGKVGLGYTGQAAASGGTDPYTFEITGLPAGLTATDAGAVSGTPTAAGSFPVTVKVTDKEGYTKTETQTIVIAAAPDIALNVTGIPAAGKVGLGYTGQAAASGGTDPYTFEMTGLPAGLTATNAGAVSGKPTAAGSFPVTVKVTDKEGFTKTETQTIVIAAAPDIALNVTGIPATGKVGLGYTGQAAASGGTDPYTFEITGLPAGLTATDAGAVSGTPTAAGSFPVTVKVTDKEGYTKTETQTIVIAAAPDIALNVTGIPTAGKVGLGYTGQAAASGGTDPYTFEITGLPAGLTATNAGAVSGKPTAVGSSTVTVKVTDKEGYTKTETQTIVIAAAPDIALNVTGIPAAGKVGLGYTGQAAASGGTEPYTFEITGLPAGLTATNAGAVSGKPTAVGSSTVTVKVTDKEGFTKTETQTIVIEAGAEIILDIGAITNGKVEFDYGSHKLTATGGTQPYTFEVSGLPDGLTFDGVDTIAGLPHKAGTFPITVIVTDKEGFTTEKTTNLVINDIIIDPASLPAGMINVAYPAQTLTVLGGTGTHVFGATGLPEGLSLSGNTISGAPTVSGSFTVEVTATSSEGYVRTRTYQLIIAAKPDIELNTSSLQDGKTGIDYKARLTAKGGTGPYSYKVSGLPDGLTLSGDTVTGIPTKAGSFDVEITVIDRNGYSNTHMVTVVIAERSALEAKNHVLMVMAGTTGSVNLMDGSTGDAVTAASILSQANAAAGKAWVESGNKAQMLYFAASGSFAGTTELSYRLASAHGVSGPATVTIHVIARPDPSEDPEVIGLVNAQIETANRMAQMQIRNFHDRLEQLHGEGDCRQDSIGLNIGLDGAQLNPKLPQSCSQRDYSLWTAGEINMGKSSDDSNDKQLKHTSIGVSGGIDYRFSPSFVGGIGFGYGKDTTDIGEKGTQSRANMFSVAAYGSYRPGKNFFLDGVVGYGWLNFESDRHVTATGGVASGERQGQQIFGSVSLGYEYRNEAWMLSPYLRGDAAHTKLDSFSETGAGIYNLTYGDQTADLLSATLGLRGEYTIPMSWGELKPRARLEYTHDFSGNSRVKLGYTDIGGLLPYTIDTKSDAKDSLRIEAGFDAKINGDWTAGVDYSTQISTGGGKLQHGFRWKLSKQF